VFIQLLRGHRRTPWTVKFHPKYGNYVASGGLAGVQIPSEVKYDVLLFLVKLRLAVP
jgi:hypothetical protein